MFIRFIFLTATLTLFSQGAFAARVRVHNPSDLRYEYQGKRYVIRPQVFTADCNSGRCVFNANGLSIAVSESQLQRLDGSSSGTSRSTRGSGEIAGSGAQDSYTPRSTYNITYSTKGSNLAQCYKNVGEKYATKRGCTNGNRNRCSGYKSPTKSTKSCYRYVKLILQDCGATRGYISGALAKDAGSRLTASGFTKLSTLNPDNAPVGSVIVYSNNCSNAHPAGHIEIKTGAREYISDYIASKPRSRVTSCRRVKGIYLKN
jgi:hypothetical protein